jgi:hypothetical protein
MIRLYHWDEGVWRLDAESSWEEFFEVNLEGLGVTALNAIGKELCETGEAIRCSGTGGTYKVTCPAKAVHNLGALTGRVLRELALEDEALMEARWYGMAGECGELIRGGTMRRIAEIVAEVGLTVREFYDEVLSRTSPHYVYTTGLTALLGTPKPHEAEWVMA